MYKSLSGSKGFEEKRGAEAVRSWFINKILSFQYRLGKIIGRKRASQICIIIDRTFTAVFGREVYGGKR